MTASKFRANEISIEELKVNYNYNPDTGELLKLRGGVYVPIGYVDSKGYLSVCHNRTVMKVHRMCYALYYGSWPEGELDHINRDPLDNRICNLRDADRFINNQNRVFTPKLKLSRKWEIFNGLLAGEDPSSYSDLAEYFPYSFKNMVATISRL